ncbi:uncharacterized protein LOC116246268 [Nymphaea colorata]|nr:uncharacterized protein LOC116246268 [Nymphaea colorata]XP_049931670.1 uncharacterized protein LOC116246268 [Nymphaea colorata]
MFWNLEAGHFLCLPTMDFGFLKSLPLVGSQSNTVVASEPARLEASPSTDWEKGNIVQQSKYPLQDLIPLRKSLLSIISWEGKTRIESYAHDSSFKAGSKKIYRSGDSGCSVPLFRPYVARVPWHKGLRAFLSQLFPRYGHYCGPNWSSGKDCGTLLWDRRPVDWLDLCCYCHDIGYDTHDQAKLLKADLAFLECLEKPRINPKEHNHWAQIYRSLYIAGLKTVLIPYRTQLVKLQARQSMVEKKLNRMNSSNRNIQHAS